MISTPEHEIFRASVRGAIEPPHPVLHRRLGACQHDQSTLATTHSGATRGLTKRWRLQNGTEFL